MKADPLSPSFTAGIWPDSGSGPYIWHCWTSWGSHASTWAFPVLFRWHPNPQGFNHTTQLLVICKLSVGALDPTMPSMMIRNSTGPNMDLWGHYSSLISILSLDFLKLSFLSIYVISTLFLIPSLSWLFIPELWFLHCMQFQAVFSWFNKLYFGNYFIVV